MPVRTPPDVNLEATKISRCPLTSAERSQRDGRGRRRRVGRKRGWVRGWRYGAQNGWMESISRRVRMCAIIYAVSYPLSSLASLPRRGPLNNASHSSIRLLGLRSGTYDHSGSLFLASNHLIRPVLRHPRVPHSIAGAYYCHSFDLGGRLQRDGEEELQLCTRLSKRNERIRITLIRYASHLKISMNTWEIIKTHT